MIQEIITENLAPCPFCGGKAELKVTGHPISDNEFMAIVRCQDCHCASPSYSTGHTMAFGKNPSRYVNLAEAKAKTAEAWNKRQTKEYGMVYRKNKTMFVIGKHCASDVFWNNKEVRRQVMDIAEARPNNFTLDAAADIFMLGYIHGKRAERARRKSRAGRAKGNGKESI